MVPWVTGEMQWVLSCILLYRRGSSNPRWNGVQSHSVSRSYSVQTWNILDRSLAQVAIQTEMNGWRWWWHWSRCSAAAGVFALRQLCHCLPHQSPISWDCFCSGGAAKKNGCINLCCRKVRTNTILGIWHFALQPEQVWPSLHISSFSSLLPCMSD